MPDALCLDAIDPYCNASAVINDCAQGHGSGHWRFELGQCYDGAMLDPWLDDTPWRVRPLPYIQGLEARSLGEINAIIIHATELPSLALAREYAEIIHYPGSQTGNSGHFYITPDGEVECWVTPDRIAHHVKGYNRPSLGIELVHPGRYPNWLASDHQAWTDPYPDPQIDALIALIDQLKVRLEQLHHIAGHDEIDRDWVEASDDTSQQVRRKLDPGPTFPWDRVIRETGLSPLVPQDADEKQTM